MHAIGSVVGNNSKKSMAIICFLHCICTLSCASLYLSERSHAVLLRRGFFFSVWLFWLAVPLEKHRVADLDRIP